MKVFCVSAGLAICARIAAGVALLSLVLGFAGPSLLAQDNNLLPKEHPPRLLIDHLPPFHYLGDSLTFSLRLSLESPTATRLECVAYNEKEKVCWRNRQDLSLAQMSDAIEVIVPEKTLLTACRLEVIYNKSSANIRLLHAEAALPSLSVRNMRLYANTEAAVILLKKQAMHIDRKWAWLKWVNRHWIKTPYIPKRILFVTELLARDATSSYTTNLKGHAGQILETCLPEQIGRDSPSLLHLIAAWSNGAWQNMDTMVLCVGQRAWQLGMDPRLYRMGLEVFLRQAMSDGISRVLLAFPPVAKPLEANTLPYRNVAYELARHYHYDWIDTTPLQKTRYWQAQTQDVRVLGRFLNAQGRQALADLFHVRIASLVPK